MYSWEMHHRHRKTQFLSWLLEEYIVDRECENYVRILNRSPCYIVENVHWEECQSVYWYGERYGEDR